MIEDILREKIGLSAESIGLRKIHSDALYRMNQCGITDMRKYAEFVQNSPEELSNLVEVITVPETWFFRMKDTFKFVEAYVLAEWFMIKKNRKLRVLSMPCATGEEPYSIAMTFFECGLKSEDFHIDAADINRVCIQKARNAVYTNHSFRGEKSDELITRYFVKKDNSFELKQHVKDAVHFFQKNIFEYYLPEAASKYDMVFCRNMLIYLDSANQQKAVKILTDVLRDDGLLFIGHSESGILFNTKFVSVHEKGSFAFRIRKSVPALPDFEAPKNVQHKNSNHTAPQQQSHPHHQHTAVNRHEKHSGHKHETNQHKTQGTDTVQHKTHINSNILQEAETLANIGDLGNAEKLCKEYMAKNKLDEKAYFLMGIVLLASGKYTEAEIFFHKAIYIKPDYYEALLSIASIKERNGDFDSARNLRERAKRIKDIVS